MSWNYKFKKHLCTVIITLVAILLPNTILCQGGGFTAISEVENMWSTYFGGSSTDKVNAAVTDDDGNVYLVGVTSSGDFPVTAGAFQSSRSGASDAFIVKLDSDGNRVFATYLGGSENDEAWDVALLSDGDIVVIGSTRSVNFPITSSAFQSSNGFGLDVFLTRFNSDGTQVWGSYMGGIFDDQGKTVSVDANDNIYIGGITASPNFPVSLGSDQSSLGGGTDGFAAKIDATNVTVEWSTYYGGTSDDQFLTSSIDSHENVYFGGTTASSNATMAGTSYQGTYGGGTSDGLLIKYDEDGTIAWSTYLGGSDNDEIHSITISDQDSVLAVGFTASSDFPTTLDAFQSTKNNSVDAFITELKSSDSDVSFSSYHGGDGDDLGYGVGYENGRIVIAGSTKSSDLSTIGSFQSSNAGNNDFFYTVIASDRSQQYTTYLGGSGEDYLTDFLVIDRTQILLTGYTGSSDAPTSTGAYQSALAGSEAGYVNKLEVPHFIDSPTLTGATKDSETQITLTFSDNVATNGTNPTDFSVTDGLGDGFVVSAQSDGTAADNKIILTVADLSTASGDLTVTYTNNNNEVGSLEGAPLATDASGVSIDTDQTAPTLVSATKDSDSQITLTFSEPVQIDGADANNFIVEDGNSNGFCVLSLTDGTAGDNQLVLGMSDLSSAVAKLTITYDLSSGNVSDFGGNNLAADATGVEITLDVTAPSGYSVSFDDDILNASEAAATKFTFSGAEVGATYNYTVSSSGGGTVVTGSGTIATATDQITLADLSGLNDGELTLSVKLTDPSNNEGTATTANANLDTTSPSLTITSDAANPQKGAFTATFTFSEDVTGFELADITLTNAVASDLNSSSASVYTALITPSSDGIITIDVASNVATDAAGNNSRAANQVGVRNDETAPTLIITSPSQATNQTFTATFTFSEDVSGFAVEDIDVNNAALDNFLALSASVYTVEVSPRLPGLVTIDVGAGVATDLAGNESTSSNQLSIPYEVTKPELISVTLKDDTKPDDATVYYIVEFSEAVNLNISDFQVDQVSGFAEGVITQATMISETSALVGFHISGSLYNEGNQKIQLLISDDNHITDLAGNALGVVDNAANDVHTTNLTYEKQSNLVLTLEDDDLPDNSVLRITPNSLGLLIPQFPQFYPDNKTRVEIELENFNSFFEEYFTGPEGQSWNTRITIKFLVEEDGAFKEAAVVGGDLKLTGSSGDNREYGTFTLSSLNFVTLTQMSSTIGTINTALMRFKLNLASVGLVNVLNERVQNFKYPLAPIMINEIGYHPDYPDSITYIELYDGGIGNITLRGGNVNEDYRTGVEKGGNYVTVTTYTENQRVTRSVDLPQLEYPNNVITTNEDGFYVINFTDPLVSFYKEVSDIIPEAGRSRMYINFGFGSNISQDLDRFDIEGRREEGYAYSLQRYHGNQRVRNDGLEWAYGIPTKGRINTIFLQGDSLKLYENTEQTFELRANGGNRVELTQGVTYAITGGPDQALFEIDETTGVLNFTNSQDFENPADADEDNEYLVDVTAYREAPYNDSNTRTIVVKVMDLPNVEVTSPVELTSGAFTATFTFSEDVTGFTSSDISVGNATLSVFSATSARIYTALITPLADGEVTIDVAANVANDADNNGNEAAVQLKVINDETAPEAPIVALSATSDLGISSSDKLTSDTTPDFEGTAEAGSTIEVFLDGSSLGTTTADTNGDWSFAISSDLSEGTRTITAAATDAAGNTSTVSEDLDIVLDLSLAVSSTSPADDETGVFPETDLSITFDKNVVKGSGHVTIKKLSDHTVIMTLDVSSDNVVVSGSNVALVTDGTLPTETDLYVNIDEGAFENEAGASFEGISDNSSWTFTTVPAAVINAVNVPTNGTYGIGDNLDFELIFSLPVTISGSPTLGITIGTTNVEAVIQGTVENATSATFRYTVQEGDMDTDGLALASSLALNGATFRDAFGLDAITTLNNVANTTTILVDGVKPTPAITSAVGSLTNAPFIATFTYDEEVTGFELADISVTNGTASNFANVTAGKVWTAIITPTVDGITTVTLNADRAVDVTGNASKAGNTISTTFDGTPPAILSMTRADAERVLTGTTSLNFTVTFNEDVIGVDASDFEVVATGTVSASINSVTATDAKTYTVNINGLTGEGTIGLNAKSGSNIMDAATNSLESGFTGEIYTTNFAPTDITLSNSVIRENNAVAAEIGTISSTDADAGDSFTYSLVSGTGSTDNASFTIDGNKLLAAETFDFETKASYSIRLRTNDGYGGVYEKAITISITNQEEALIVVEGDANFEQTVLGLSNTKNWTVTNNGDAATEVRIISSAQGFSIAPGSVQVNPGETKTITAVFRPTEAKVYTGLVVFNFDITDEIQDNVIEVGLSGEGVIVTGLDSGQIGESLINIFPNPASTNITIDLSELHGLPVDIRMINPGGVSKLDKEGYDKSELTIDVTNFESGLYIIQFSNEKSLVRKKVLIRR